MKTGTKKKVARPTIVVPTPQDLDREFSTAVSTVGKIKFQVFAEDRPDLVDVALSNISSGLKADSENIRYKYTKLVLDKTYQSQEKVDASVEHKIIIKDITDL